MARIKKKSSKNQAGISTASLPDIVFMLLFFFMASAVMKSMDPLVKYVKPDGKTLTRFENKSLLASIKVGEPVEGKKGAIHIHLDDEVLKDQTFDEDSWGRITEFIDRRRSDLDADAVHMIAAIEADNEVDMRYIKKINSLLQDSEQYKVTYLLNDAAK